MTPTPRRSDLDWLRVGAIVLLLFFHSARVFDLSEAFYVQNDQRSALLTYGLIGFFGRWGMELLFVISGMASWYALSGRSGRTYLRDRWSRLGLPFLFGVLVLVPPQGYFAQLQQSGAPTASYPAFLGRYFTDWSDLSGYPGSFTPAHLWFLLFLLAYSALALPFFHWWKAPARAPLRETLASTFRGRGSLLIWSLPLALAAALPGVGGKNLTGYLLYFVFGYLLAATPKYQRTIDRDRQLFALVGLGSWAALTAAWVLGLSPADGSVGDLLTHLLRTLCAWSSVLALLGYAHTHLRVSRTWLARANEAAFPVYIVHQTVLVAAAFFLVRLHLPLSLKYLLVVLATFAGSLAAYAVVQAFDPLRVLFGLRRRERRRVTPALEA
ncbi:acyltransferase family protein [Deinococcus apachensis]|uniref:acyltransferase family protein n=1 Tax=Deinococcus apachensis TaxID=309886 RepID=UPI00037144AC|nr:acyltransferase [Deinococcus apachensis]